MTPGDIALRLVLPTSSDSAMYAAEQDSHAHAVVVPDTGQQAGGGVDGLISVTVERGGAMRVFLGLASWCTPDYG